MDPVWWWGWFCWWWWQRWKKRQTLQTHLCYFSQLVLIFRPRARKTMRKECFTHCIISTRALNTSLYLCYFNCFFHIWYGSRHGGRHGRQHVMLQFGERVGCGCWFIGPKLCSTRSLRTRLACLLSFASLLSTDWYLLIWFKWLNIRSLWNMIFFVCFFYSF